MNIKFFEQLRVSISLFTTASAKEEMLEDKVALKRPSLWPLKSQNPIPISHAVEKMPNMGINCHGNTENQVLCLKTRKSGFF